MPTSFEALVHFMPGMHQIKALNELFLLVLLKSRKKEFLHRQNTSFIANDLPLMKGAAFENFSNMLTSNAHIF